MAKINFPNPAIDGQLYPDLDAGDPPLESDKVYVFDGGIGAWKILCGEESFIIGDPPIVVTKDPYSDYITNIEFDPTQLPKITLP